MPDDALARELRERGMRLTPQRQRVLRTVRDLGHSTPEQVAERAGAAGDRMSAATVYRTLDLLESLGLVRHTHIGPGPATYHAAEDADHVHTRCQGCGAVSSMASRLLDEVADVLRREHGFHLDPNHVALSGLCSDCFESMPDAPPGIGQERHDHAH